MQFQNEVLLEALDVFKNYQTSISSTRNLNFLFISIRSDFSKSETVVGQIFKSVLIVRMEFKKNIKLKLNHPVQCVSTKVCNHLQSLFFWYTLLCYYAHIIHIYPFQRHKGENKNTAF